jgi:hypothetical protein
LRRHRHPGLFPHPFPNAVSLVSRADGAQARSGKSTACGCRSPLAGDDRSAIAGHAGFADVVSAQLPSVPADRAPARTRPSMASDMRALLARSAVRLGVVKRRAGIVARHPRLAFPRDDVSSAMICAQEARGTGSLEHGERATAIPGGWPPGCGPVRRRHKGVPSANPGGGERIRSAGMCGGRVRGVAFPLVSFSWRRKRKEPERGRRAGKRQGSHRERTAHPQNVGGARRCCE